MYIFILQACEESSELLGVIRALKTIDCKQVALPRAAMLPFDHRSICTA
jgi:hypothetical protein